MRTAPSERDGRARGRCWAVGQGNKQPSLRGARARRASPPPSCACVPEVSSVPASNRRPAAWRSRAQIGMSPLTKLLSWPRQVRSTRDRPRADGPGALRRIVVGEHSANCCDHHELRPASALRRRHMPPREAYRQRWQPIASLGFDGAPRVSAEHVQLVILPCVPRRLAGKVIVGFHRRSVSSSGAGPIDPNQ